VETVIYETKTLYVIFHVLVIACKASIIYILVNVEHQWYMFDIITNKYDTSRECTRVCINMDPIESIKLYTDW